ncbi:MAG: OmpA family protein [Gammaproteobacteria bacterium]|nr:OmpA family protein [Gammaproteobacteria bacterium]
MTTSDKTHIDASEHGSTGTVDKIRELVLGSDISGYNQKIQALETLISGEVQQSIAELNSQLESIEASLNQRMNQSTEAIQTELNDLDRIRKHIFDSSQRINDTAEILIDSIHVVAEKKHQLVNALSGTVDECIRDNVTRDPQSFADSLFPVMGPAIRKSITETLRSFVQSTNQMIEHSMSPQSLRWRWEAKRSGVPFTEIVLKHSLLYRVEEIFLIQQGTGLLIEHVSHPDVSEHDSDAVSAMLTVIRDFARDSFSPQQNDNLHSVEFGEKTLWIIDGPKAILACVNRGLVPETNRTELRAVLEQVHSEHGAEIEQFSGDRGENTDIQYLLQSCLTQQSRQASQEKKAINWFKKPFTWIALLGIILFGLWQWKQYDQQNRLDSLLSELKSIAGVVVVGADRQDDHVVVKVLSDPLAQELQGMPGKHGFSPAQLQIKQSLFQSLDPSIAVLRAGQILKPPDTVKLEADTNHLLISGKAKQHWIDSISSMRDSVPGFVDFNLNHLKVDHGFTAQLLRERLNAPESVNLRLQENTLLVTGHAPLHWIEDLSVNVKKISNELTLMTSDQSQQLQSNESLRLKALIQEINGDFIYFVDDVQINSDRSVISEQQNAKIRELIELSDLLNGQVNVMITGYADGVGKDEDNRDLKLRRAEKVRQILIREGLEQSLIQVQASDIKYQSEQVDLSERRVDLEIQVDF